MTDKIKVLVVDDSLVVRKLIGDIVAAEADLELIGTASNGAAALGKLDQNKADVVVLDIEMPGMSGLDVVVEIRKRASPPAVIMFSATTQRAASTTLEALARGASDYVTKPTGTTGLDASMDVVRSQLLPKIRVLVPRGRSRATSLVPPPRPPSSPPPLTRSATPAASPPASPRTPSASSVSSAANTSAAAHGSISSIAASVDRAFDVLAIGSSTGGPNALAALLRELPKNLGVPVLIVQHMPPVFTKLLADRLAATSPLPAEEARDGQEIVPDHVYVAPGDHHMTVSRAGPRTTVVLNQDPPENSCRPAVDVLFRSVAATYGARTLAVVLTGMGQDGLVGAEIIQHAGGMILVQDEESSVVWGMPGFIARAGLATSVKPLAELPQEILRRLRQPRSGGVGAASTRSAT